MKRIDVEQRIKAEALYIIETDSTLREAAKQFGYSKSTLWRDMSELLEKIDLELYKKVKETMNRHLELRAVKGGETIKIKYQLQRNLKEMN